MAPPSHPLRELASDDEAALLQGLSDRCRSHLRNRHAGAPVQPEVTSLYASFVDVERVSLGSTDILSWMQILAHIGASYADAWRREKDRWRGLIEHGRSRAWDDLMSVSDPALLASSEATTLFPFAFVPHDPITDVDLPALARRCDTALQAAIPQESAAFDAPTVSMIRDFLRRVAPAPPDLVSGRGLFELCLLLSLTELFQIKTRDALLDPSHVTTVDGIPENYGLRFDRLRRGLGSLPRLAAVLRLRAPGQECSIFDHHNLPAYDLLRLT